MRLYLIIFTVILNSSSFGAKLESISWDTAYASPPFALVNGGDLLTTFRTALTTLPESTIVTLALSQPDLLGLSPTQAAIMQPLLADRYRLISESALYAKADSLLPYSFSGRQPAKGAANVYLPDHPGPTSPVILFLHGYGGSFLWYQHWLSESFPEAIIIYPAFGVNPESIPPEYLQESLTTATKHLGFTLSRPSLVGLSAGGVGAARAYVTMPGIFSQLICIGSDPPDGTLRKFPQNGMVLFMAGEKESFVVSRRLQTSVQTIRGICPGVSLQIIPQADHFFLLTHSNLTLAILKTALRPQPNLGH